jgi:nucleoside-diphosphate-sugar epimerase
MLITGGTGFLGESLIQKILMENSPKNNPLVIDIITRQSSLNAANFFRIPEEKNILINFHKKNINELDSLPSKSYDYVIHAASPSSQERFQKKNSKIERFKTVAIGTYNLLNLSGRYKFKKFLLFSSGAIYSNDSKGPQSENSHHYSRTNDELSFYSEAKRASETMTVLFSEINKFKFNIARIFAVIGPGMYLKLDSGYIFSQFIKSSYENKPLVIDGNKDSVRSFLDIDDATNFFMKLINSDVSSEVFNVGSNEAISLYDLAKKFNLALKKNNQILFSDAKEKTFLIPDIRKSQQLLNWHPKVNLNESITKIFKIYAKRDQ